MGVMSGSHLGQDDSQRTDIEIVLAAIFLSQEKEFSGGFLMVEEVECFSVLHDAVLFNEEDEAGVGVPPNLEFFVGLAAMDDIRGW